MKKSFKLLSLLLLILIFSCSDNSSKVYDTLVSDFSDSIEKYNATRFDFQYDALTPQSSYFVGCKLKFLKLESNGEIASIRQKVTFENDSISRIFMVKSINIENRNKQENIVSIVDYRNRIVKTYINDKLERSVKVSRSSKKEQEFIYEIKNNTEIKYNCGKLKINNNR